MPPFLNTGVIIDDGRGNVAVASLPGWFRRKLRRLLSANGFTIEEHATLFSLGWNRVKPWP